MAYWTVRVACLVALTRVSGVAVITIVGKVKGAEIMENRNRQRVFQPRTGTVPPKILGLVDLVKAVPFVVSAVVNTCFSLLTPFDFRHKCWFSFSFTLWFCYQLLLFFYSAVILFCFPWSWCCCYSVVVPFRFQSSLCCYYFLRWYSSDSALRISKLSLV